MAIAVGKKSVNIEDFTRSVGQLIANDDTAYVKGMSRDLHRSRSYESDVYTEEEIDRIIKEGTTADRKALSVHFFKHNSIYKKIILHYASFLTYQYILVPHTPIEDGFSDPTIMLSYDDAVDFLYHFDVEDKCSYFTYKILVEGAYYGLVKENSNNKPTLMDLPI